eukprot:c24132_g4_i1 orf=283-1083(-)
MVVSTQSPENRLERLPQQYLQHLLPPAGAALTYGLSLQAVQIAGRACRISCSTLGWSSILGCLAVSSSSLAAGQVSFAIRKYLKHGPGRPKDFIISKEDAAFAMVTGLVAFKILGGSFCDLMPSHVCKRGALANFSLRASGPNLASSLQSKEINKAFLRDGCHHCGRRSGKSIADHIPPSMIIKALQQQQRNQGFWAGLFKVPKNTAQRFYPQCESCMKRQSAFLINGKDPFVYHWKRGIPKPSHLSGFLLGAFTYEGSSSDDTPQ